MGRKAIICQSAKNAMQSAAHDYWTILFPTDDTHAIDPLMGWVGMKDTQQELNLQFEDVASAERYAKASGFDYEVIEPKKRKIMPKSYAANFAYDKQAF